LQKQVGKTLQKAGASMTTLSPAALS